MGNNTNDVPLHPGSTHLEQEAAVTSTTVAAYDDVQYTTQTSILSGEAEGTILLFL